MDLHCIIQLNFNFNESTDILNWFKIKIILSSLCIEFKKLAQYHLLLRFMTKYYDHNDITRVTNNRET